MKQRPEDEFQHIHPFYIGVMIVFIIAVCIGWWNHTENRNNQIKYTKEIVDMDKQDIFTPSDIEKKEGMVCKNACQCKICGSNADRFSYGLVCQQNPNHMGDLFVGIFTDLTPPE